MREIRRVEPLYLASPVSVGRIQLEETSSTCDLDHHYGERSGERKDSEQQPPSTLYKDFQERKRHRECNPEANVEPREALRAAAQARKASAGGLGLTAGAYITDPYVKPTFRARKNAAKA